VSQGEKGAKRTGRRTRGAKARELAEIRPPFALGENQGANIHLWT
jgi:hypothetical protein